MRKFLLTAFLGMSALFVNAQQWSGSTTTADTIYRYGIADFRPTLDGNPYVQISNENIKVRKSYGTQYPIDMLTISPHLLSIGIGIPAPTPSTSIYAGKFYFTNIASDGHSLIRFNLDSSGDLISDGDIQCINLNASYLHSTNTATLNYCNISERLNVDNISVNGATTTSTYKLAVNSGILCEELKVMADVPSSDYVFEPSYKLKPLSEVEAFVTENKHLPDVPSAKEFKENGYKIGEMDNLLLQKIEELTLYIIDLQKQIEELQKEK